MTTTTLITPLSQAERRAQEAVNAAALLRMELEEAATDRDRYKRERDLALRENERMREALMEQRLKPGVRAVIAAVQHRATVMNDWRCKAWHNSLAFELGLQLKRDRIDLSEAVAGSMIDAALETVG